VFGSINIACVIVPVLMNGLRSCGIRGVLGVAAVWLGKATSIAGLPVMDGVMLTGGMVGAPLAVVQVPWASNRRPV
jgi:hypothetical protein